MCLYVSIARQDVSVGAALGFTRCLASGQHMGSCGCLFWCCLASLEPVVYQGYKEQHHAANHRRHPSQREGHLVVSKVITQET